MTLLHEIIKKVKSREALNHGSPPPEVDVDEIIKPNREKNYKYKHVKAKVVTSPPLFPVTLLRGSLYTNMTRSRQLTNDNYVILKSIMLAQPRVDSRWQHPLPTLTVYYQNRVNFWKKLPPQNRKLYKLFTNAGPKVVTTQSLLKDWAVNRKRMIKLALKKFILFPPVPEETIEDPVFRPLPGVTRIRLLLHLRVREGCAIGKLPIELFSEVCPATCHLFLELLLNDPKTEYSYIGTKFFRKIPEYFWSGGDVVYNDGMGCYAQKGRTMPIGAENYRFSHSMPGLLTMPVTQNNEVCGIFKILFKPLKQLDNKNVCFGRVIRPSSTFEGIRLMGSGDHGNPRPFIILDGYTIVKSTQEKIIK